MSCSLLRAKIFAALIALLFSGASWAGYASAIIGGGAAKTGGGWSVKGAQASAANGSFNTPGSINSAGRQINLGGSAQFAANAASFAVGAVRLNPTSLFVSFAAQWLIGQGLNYVGDQWQKTSTGANKTGLVWSTAPASGVFRSDPSIVCGILSGDWHGVQVAWNKWNCVNAAGTYQDWYVQPYSCPGGVEVINVGGVASCGPGTTTTNPATDADFVTAGQGTLPDNVAQQLAQADVPIPVNSPVLNSSPVDSYSNPYLDPVSGRMVKEMTRVTPDPTPDDPFNVRVERYQVDAGAVPGQTAAPTAAPKEANVSNQPSKNATENPDLCATNPGILACEHVAPGAGAATGNLYTPDATGKSFANSINAFKTAVATSGIYAAAGGFFNAGNITGACSGLDTTFNLVGQTFTIELSPYFCGAWAESLYHYLAIGMLLLATAAAFAIAIL